MIKQFSSVVGISTKALRLYDEMKLLEPEFIDADTGYRYYTSRQIKRTALIIQLKTIGFSLQEIKMYFEGKLPLCKKKMLLEEKKRVIDGMLSGIDFLDKKENIYSAYIKTEPEMSVVSKTVYAKHFKELLPGYYNFLENEVIPSCRLIIPEHITTEFLSSEYSEDNLNVIFRVGVLKSSTLPLEKIKPKKYVTTIHKGNYSSLADAYSFLEEYMRVCNIKTIGYPSERYFENYYSEQAEENYITEVRFPIEN